jgi:hypothetical protein
MIAGMSRADAPALVTFVVRASRDEAGGVRGSVTRVRTGEAAPFEGIAGAVRVLAEMLTGDFGGPRVMGPGPGTMSRPPRDRKN